MSSLKNLLEKLVNEELTDKEKAGLTKMVAELASSHEELVRKTKEKLDTLTERLDEADGSSSPDGFDIIWIGEDGSLYRHRIIGGDIGLLKAVSGFAELLGELTHVCFPVYRHASPFGSEVMEGMVWIRERMDVHKEALAKLEAAMGPSKKSLASDDDPEEDLSLDGFDIEGIDFDGLEEIANAAEEPIDNVEDEEEA